MYKRLVLEKKEIIVKKVVVVFVWSEVFGKEVVCESSMLLWVSDYNYNVVKLEKIVVFLLLLLYKFMKEDRRFEEKVVVMVVLKKIVFLGFVVGK